MTWMTWTQKHPGKKSTSLYFHVSHVSIFHVSLFIFLVSSQILSGIMYSKSLIMAKKVSLHTNNISPMSQTAISSQQIKKCKLCNNGIKQVSHTLWANFYIWKVFLLPICLHWHFYEWHYFIDGWCFTCFW